MEQVKFNSVDEFCEELGKGDYVIDGLVRVTALARNTNTLPIRHLFEVATYVRGSSDNRQIVRLEEFCGQVWGLGEQDAKAYNRATEIAAKVRDACHAHKPELEIRAGVIESV